MIQNSAWIMDGFIEALARARNILLSKSEITHEQLRAPHDCPNMPNGRCAVYVFSLHSACSAPAGPNRVLKVGRAGPKTIVRFKYQHYRPGSAGSTLAGAIVNNRILWDYIGYDASLEDAGSWLKANTDRDHFLLPIQREIVLPQLEAYVRGLLGPVYEGSMKGE